MIKQPIIEPLRFPRGVRLATEADLPRNKDKLDAPTRISIALFAGSIAENIGFVDANADKSWIEECAKIAAIHHDIVTMPMAYNTFVGYGGSALWGGQKQRILLARAIYKRPKILLLDEATSHLDVKREVVVSASVRALRMTRVIVAHRPQTIETAERVISFDAGHVVSDVRQISELSMFRAASIPAS